MVFPLDQRPLLVVCTFNKRVNDYLCHSIADVIGHLVDIRGYSKDECCFFDREPALVVTSGPYAAELAQSAFPGAPLVAATRVLTGINIEQVLAIPHGTRVLVVSNPEGPVLETIDLLMQAGIDHISYEGYWPGKDIDLDQFDYAITPNMLYVCPHAFKHVINLQQKALSVRTFMEILTILGIDLHYADIFENRYFRIHIDTCRKVVQALGRSEQLGRTQSLILDQMEEALISTTAKGQFLFVNRQAKKLFGLDEHFRVSAELRRAIDTLDRAQLQNTPGHRMTQCTQNIILNVYEDHFFCYKAVISAESGIPQIFYSFRKIEQIQEMERSLRNKLYAREFSAKYTFHDIWGNSSKLMQNKAMAKMFAKTNQTILLVGESGTGKELMAQAIHNASPRASAPFVAVNLAAFSRSLLESELFGYESGAFTGAQKKGKIGLFEIANHGTIFLDEIGDAPLDVQILLLRVLEERVITRVGGIHQIPVDLRIIAATNRPLQDMVRDGTFRIDLYYRLNVLSIHTQPVRSMPGEIVPFLQQYIHRLSGSVKEFSPQAEQLLQEYSWPGNFRELRNVAEFLHCISPGTKAIAAEQLPQYLLEELSSIPCPKEEPMLPDPLSLHILRLLRSARPKCVGRGYLVAALEKEGVSTTEREVKGRLLQLQEQGLVRIGSTRQGTAISNDGMELLSIYDDAGPN